MHLRNFQEESSVLPMGTRFEFFKIIGQGKFVFGELIRLKKVSPLETKRSNSRKKERWEKQ